MLIKILIFIALLFIILFNLSVVIYVTYIDEDFKYNIKILFFNIIPKNKILKSKKIKTVKKVKHKLDSFEIKNEVKNYSDKNQESKKENVFDDKKQIKNKKIKNKNLKKIIKKKKKKDLQEKIIMIKMLLDSSGKAFKYLIKKIRLKDLYINIKVSSEDAYECAMNFGKINSLIYNILLYLDKNITVKKKSIYIIPGYNEKKSNYDFSFNLKLKTGVIIFASINILVRYIFKNLKKRG